jgi:L-iditol 2-dehydrogenase
MSVMLTAKAKGVSKVYVTDKIDQRLSIALIEGASYTGNPLANDIVADIRKSEPMGLDLVFECCGQQEAMDQAVDIIKPGGKIIGVGIPEFESWLLNVENTRRREITLQFIRRQVDCVEPALDYMNKGEIDISNMITHRFSFGETKKAFDLVAGYKDGVMKAMIDF